MVEKKRGRPRTCDCGVCAKCKNRDKARAAYQALTPEEKRARLERRDPAHVRSSEWVRNGKPERQRYVKENVKRWRHRYPERASAQRKVAWAVKTGKLVKQPCETCGAEKVHAHHDDYGKPLDVRWLCPLHHAAERQK